MKKHFPILIIILCSAVFLVSVDYLPVLLDTNNSYYISFEDNDEETNRAYSEIKEACSELADENNIKAKYDEQMIKIQLYSELGVLSLYEASKLQDLANVGFAQSLINDFNDWRNNYCTSSYSGIYTKMRDLSINPDCKSMLAQYINAFNDYNYILNGLQWTVTNFLNSEYTSGEHSTILNLINSRCNNPLILGCSNIENKRASLSMQLTAFKKFANDYISEKKYYLGDEEDRKYDFRVNYCPRYNSEITKYKFYHNDILSLSVCN